MYGIRYRNAILILKLLLDKIIFILTGLLNVGKYIFEFIFDARHFQYCVSIFLVILLIFFSIDDSDTVEDALTSLGLSLQILYTLILDAIYFLCHKVVKFASVAVNIISNMIPTSIKSRCTFYWVLESIYKHVINIYSIVIGQLLFDKQLIFLKNVFTNHSLILESMYLNMTKSTYDFIATKFSRKELVHFFYFTAFHFVNNIRFILDSYYIYSNKIIESIIYTIPSIANFTNRYVDIILNFLFRYFNPFLHCMFVIIFYVSKFLRVFFTFAFTVAEMFKFVIYLVLSSIDTYFKTIFKPFDKTLTTLYRFVVKHVQNTFQFIVYNFDFIFSQVGLIVWVILKSVVHLLKLLVLLVFKIVCQVLFLIVVILNRVEYVFLQIFKNILFFFNSYPMYQCIILCTFLFAITIFYRVDEICNKNKTESNCEDEFIDDNFTSEYESYINSKSFFKESNSLSHEKNT